MSEVDAVIALLDALHNCHIIFGENVEGSIENLRTCRPIFKLNYITTVPPLKHDGQVENNKATEDPSLYNIMLIYYSINAIGIYCFNVIRDVSLESSALYLYETFLV